MAADPAGDIESSRNIDPGVTEQVPGETGRTEPAHPLQTDPDGRHKKQGEDIPPGKSGTGKPTEQTVIEAQVEGQKGQERGGRDTRQTAMEGERARNPRHRDQPGHRAMKPATP